MADRLIGRIVITPLRFPTESNLSQVTSKPSRTTARLSEMSTLSLGGVLTLALSSLLCGATVVGAADQRLITDADLERRFEEVDRDHNGQISPAEFPHATRFRVIDVDHNGAITIKEVRSYVQSLITARSTPAAQFQVPVANATSKGSIQQRFNLLKPSEYGVGRIVPDPQVRDIDGNAYRLSDFKSHGATVVAVTSTSCPLSRRYLTTLARLEKTYAKEVRFLFVNPMRTDADEAIRSAIQTNALAGPYIRDPDGSFLSGLGAKSTTDCFVIDKALTLCYRGAVDDQYGLGYALSQPRQSLLVDALDAVLAGQTPQTAATEAPGCLLNLSTPTNKSAPQGGGEGLTYHKRISRIMQANCVECHRTGGVAPFSLTGHDDLVTRAEMIKKVVKDGTMPPWFAAPPRKGTTSIWANDRSLAAADRADLEAWLNGDRRLGEASDAPVSRVISDTWQLGEPDAIVQLPTPVAIPAEGVLPYQKITVRTNFSDNRWIRGFEFQPTAREVVHHVGVFVESGPQPEQQGNDAENRGAYLALYVPGNNWRLFPAGCAKLLPKGATLRFQIHYTPNGTPTHDQTRLGLYFAKEPPQHELHVTGVVNLDLKIPPQASRHEVSGWLTLKSDVQILSFLPHMHVRGKAFRFQAISNRGDSALLLDVPRYDFNWQLAYHLSKPRSLARGTRLKVTGWFDNSSENPANPDPSKTVYWGPQTHDEMLLGYFEYIVPGEVLTSKVR